jgi:hypothetical protein
MKKKIYRIFNAKTQKYEGVYQRGYHDQYDFGSPDEARNSNVHGIYQSQTFEIHEFEIDEILTNRDAI